MSIKRKWVEGFPGKKKKKPYTLNFHPSAQHSGNTIYYYMSELVRNEKDNSDWLP